MDPRVIIKSLREQMDNGPMPDAAVITRAELETITRDWARGEQLKREVANKDRALEARNVALDGMAWVWCDGGCRGGVFRFTDMKLTDEMLALIVRNTERLKRWARSRDYRARQIGEQTW